MLIAFLYMFRVTLCPSSGENTVPMRHLVFVTFYVYSTLCTPRVFLKRFDIRVVGQSSLRAHGVYKMLKNTRKKWQIPGVAKVRYFLPIMGTYLPETCREKQ